MKHMGILINDGWLMICVGRILLRFYPLLLVDDHDPCTGNPLGKSVWVTGVTPMGNWEFSIGPISHMNILLDMIPIHGYNMSQ